MKSQIPKTFRLLTPLALAVAPAALFAGTFSADFNKGQAPAMTQVFGNAAVESTGGVNDSGVLKLTKAINSQLSSFIIEDLDAGADVYGFRMSMNVRVGGGTQTPADGWSVNFATDLTDGAFSETGAGTGLTVVFDTYDNVDGDPNNGAGEAPQISLKIGGQVVARSGLLKVAEMTTGSQFVPVNLNLNADGSFDLDFNGKVIFSKLYFPNYQPFSGARFGFGARTGGANENCFIDDLKITTLLTPLPGLVQQPQNRTVIQGSRATFAIQLNNDAGATIQWLRNGTAIPGATATSYTLPSVSAADAAAKFSAKVSLGTTTLTSTEATLKVVTLDLPATPALSFNFNDGAAPAGTAVFGSAFVSPSGGVGKSGVLVLTDALNDQSGSFLVDDPALGAPVYGIAARFDLRMGAGTEPPADGFSFNFGTDLPETSGNVEDGVGTGLSVTADVYDNGNGEAPSFSVKFRGALLADVKVPRSAMQTGDEFADIIIRLTPDGLLDLAWNGTVIFDRVFVSGFDSFLGGRIGLYARTGGLYEVHAVDNLRIYTYLTPAQVRITSQPQPLTALLGKPATFAVGVNLPDSTTYQWFKNGAVIAGATQNTLTIAATTAADQGAKFKVQVQRGAQTVTSDEVSLSVVDLSAPANPQLNYDFNAGLPAGAEIAGVALVDKADGVAGSGVLKLTQAQNGQVGGFRSASVAGGAQLLDFTIAAEVFSGGGTTPPADGFSISIGGDVPANPPGEAENGAGTGISICFDTYDNTDGNPNNETGEAPSVDIRYKGQVVVSKRLPLGVISPDDYFTVLIRVRQDGSVDVACGNTVVYNGYKVPNFAPLSGVKVGLYARTGGLNANYWFDNLRLGATLPSNISISREPSDALALVGQRATFSVQPSNPQGVTYQWSRDGLLIPNATQASYTTPALTLTDDGAGFSVQLTGPGNKLTSRTARLGVMSAFDAGTKPAINLDFNDGSVPIFSSLNGSAFIENGVLKLTINENGQSSSFVLETPAGIDPINDFTATWRMRVGGGSAVPADGFSFVLGPDIPDAPWGEDGTGSGLSIAFDIYDNGGGEAPAIDVFYKGESVASRKFDISVLRTGDAFVTIGVRVNRTGTLDLYYGDTAVYRDLILPRFQPFSAGRFGWGARTGGLNENQWLDDLKISVNTQPTPVDKPVFTSIKRNGDGTITISWTGGGALQSSPTVAGPWQDVAGASSPYTFSPTSPAFFGRIRK